MYYDFLETPIGRMTLFSDGEALCAIDLPEARRPRGVDARCVRNPALFDAARAQLGEYFVGQRQTFDLPLAPRGTTFQMRVWDALCTIPYGQTISYAELAQRVGNPRASRAVGLANGANPIAPIIPCHRVIGANGSLTGYGGGMSAKRFLLDLEARHDAAAPRLF